MLRIAKDLNLPDDAAVETMAILAVRGAGKSNAAVVLAEEMFRAGIPWVAIDPKGDWWGIRSSADGKGPGLPVALFGSVSRKRKDKPDPDVPLEETGGKLIADLVVDERLPCILDMSAFSEAAKIRFLIDFGSQLFERNTEPLHLFMDECDDFIPQKPFKEQTRLLHIYTKILKQGRSFGLGATLISQRSAVVNKNALTQVGTLFALRTTSPQDRHAIAEWIKQKDGKHLEIVESLPSLKDGEAWVWSPEFLGDVQRFRFNRRKTFDSGATPKVGAKRVQVKTVANVDLAALESAMSETIERARADDPDELRSTIRRLERELEQMTLAAKSAFDQDKCAESCRVAVARRDEEWANVWRQTVGEFKAAIRHVADDFHDYAKSIGSLLTNLDADVAKIAKVMTPLPVRQQAPRPEPPPSNRRSARPAQPSTNGNDEIKGGGCLRMIQLLADAAPKGYTESQWATAARLKKTGGTWTTYKSRLKNAALAEERGGLWYATQTAIDEYADASRQPQTTAELIEWWKSKVGSGPARMIDELVDVYPLSIDREELAERVGITYGAGTFATYLSRLRSNNLAMTEANMIRATSDLMGE